MNRNLGLAAFFTGLMVVAWVAVGYAVASPLALAMTALIGVFYLMGALELRRFHQATLGLVRALQAVPEPLPALGGWLDGVPASLQNPVRLRIEGERIGLPGPALTPYLVGLLVLLGMLGTFLGMVVTLNGAVMALESTTDLPTIRAALAAPVKGLGLAFGTSVAGVAASAMLGLLSALCRSERGQAAQQLDVAIGTRLRAFSLAHQRQEAFQALQSQARAMPDLVTQLQAVVAQMARQGQDFNERSLAGQERFHRDAQAVHAELAASVDRSLKHSLTEGARLAGAALQPVVEATMAGIERQAATMHEKVAGNAALLHERVADRVAAQLDGVSARFAATVGTVSQTWTDALAQHQRTSERLSADVQASLATLAQRFDQRSVSLLDGVGQAQAALQADLAASERQRQAALGQSLEAMAASLQREWQQAGASALGQQAQICRTLEQTARDLHTQAQAQTRETMAELATLMQAASEAPRAAAEVMGLLRQRLSDSLGRDNEMLEERGRIMQTLGGLLQAVHHATTEQRGAIDALVTSSAELLHQVGSRFTEQVEVQSARMNEAAAQVTGSAVEVASLGEAFGFAVQLFGESSQSLTAHLQRMEALLDKSGARSDEQLAYYVAQAREIIDLSIMSQKQIVDDLRQLSSRQAALAGEAS